MCELYHECDTIQKMYLEVQRQKCTCRTMVGRAERRGLLGIESPARTGKCARPLGKGFNYFPQLEIQIDLGSAIGAAAIGVVISGLGDVGSAGLAGAFGDGDDLCACDPRCG